MFGRLDTAGLAYTDITNDEAISEFVI